MITNIACVPKHHTATERHNFQQSGIDVEICLKIWHRCLSFTSKKFKKWICMTSPNRGVHLTADYHAYI